MSVGWVVVVRTIGWVPEVTLPLAIWGGRGSATFAVFACQHMQGESRKRLVALAVVKIGVRTAAQVFDAGWERVILKTNFMWLWSGACRRR